MKWIDAKKQAPPFDDLVVVKWNKYVEGQFVNGWTGEVEEYADNIPQYAIAYNECFPPLINMTMVIHDTKRESRCLEADIEAWAYLDD